MQSVHKGVLFTCDQCSYKSALNSYLKKHIESVHSRKSNQSFPNLKCDQCNFTSTDENKLSFHKLSVHKGVLFTCDQCSYKSSLNSYLKKHIESVHSRK